MKPRPVGLVVRVSASHAVGWWFTPLTGHIKYHHKNGTNYLPAWQAWVRVGVQPVCLKAWVVCGTVLKRYPGINCKSRVWYPGPGFISSATWPLMSKKHYNGLIKQLIIEKELLPTADINSYL